MSTQPENTPGESKAGVEKKTASHTTNAPTHPAKKAAQRAAQEALSTRGLIIWLTAVLLYTMAVTGRTSFGVASVEAIEQYHIDATRLAVFASLQLGAYSLSQIPVGLMVDKFGPRKLLIAGALVMGVGQVILAFGSSYPVALFARVLVGMGDATAFSSLMRLIPAWIPMRLAPMLSQLSGALGQFGQFLSAVPFLALLHATSWTTAFFSLGAMGLLLALMAAVLIQDSPDAKATAEGAAKDKTRNDEDLREPEQQPKLSLTHTLREVLTNPTCWHGFFVHWTGLGTLVAFTMLWGVPIMTIGMGQSSGYAGLALTLATVATVVAGPFVGIMSSRMGRNRWIVTITGSSLTIACWILLFLPTDPRGAAFGLTFAIVMGAMAPVSNLGFDSVREQVDRSILATGTGLANMGGWTAGIIIAQTTGLVLSWAAPDEDYAWADFRLAAIAAVAVWMCGVIGIVATRPRTSARSPRRISALRRQKSSAAS
ncbi:MFS transporter [Corynebacterium dentalis]|uniref:MFS transporter n=1 Tax=Corynebacterium dentalis TaxID=2014528 RepID=UPI002896F4B2|nr:MFS transporter [Corynebacterium dentalis]